MSDLQDVIASTSVKAFNSGYLQGAWDERMRIVQIIEEQPRLMHDELINGAALIALIKGEQK